MGGGKIDTTIKKLVRGGEGRGEARRKTAVAAVTREDGGGDNPVRAVPPVAPSIARLL